jgi:Domain of unknown function (DUF1840)
MLIPFHSKAAGDFYMLEPNAQTLLLLMGKTYTPQGIILASEISMCLEQLQAGLNTQNSHDRLDSAATDQDQSQVAVGLKQRAWPLIDMLTRAQKKGVDVLWGTVV